MTEPQAAPYQSMNFPAYIRFDELMDMYPSLKELYNYDATAHSVVHMLLYAQNQWNLVALIVQLLENNREKSMLLEEAVRRGYAPSTSTPYER